MNSFSKFLSSTLGMYGRCGKKATYALIHNWPALVGMCILFAVVQFLSSLVQPLGIAGGFIIGFAFIGALTLYYGWIRESCDQRRVRWRDLWQFDSGLFSSVMHAGFLLWLIELVNRSLAQDESTRNISILLSIAILLLLNPLPEVVYRDENDGIGTLRRSFEFLREYWIEWLIPFGILIAPIVMTSVLQATLLMASSASVLAPIFTIFQLAEFALAYFGLLGANQFSIAFALLGPLVISHWFMIFRGFLFLELTRGKRG